MKQFRNLKHRPILGYVVVPTEYDEGGYAPSSCFWGRDTAAKMKKALRPAAIVVQQEQ